MMSSFVFPFDQLDFNLVQMTDIKTIDNSVTVVSYISLRLNKLMQPNAIENRGARLVDFFKEVIST